jgi:CheY-like chemotaxis protein/two-component sensor histidine kinase
MERQVGQMVRLLDDLLDIARITRSCLQLRRERVELATIVHNAVETSRPLIETRRHELTLSLPSRPIEVDADPMRLAQVISNLLNNAAKYTEEGGRIQLCAQRDGDAVVLSVRDNGIGIAEEHLPGIFEMFSQVESALERSHGGLGIGLALVRALVELHGGRVDARSAGKGAGSEFIVRLPAGGTSAAEETPEPAQVSPLSRKRRILVVDDNRDAAQTLALILRAMGHDVETAGDGPSALRTASALRPETVVLDIGLPGMNGYEVARRIRQESWGGGVTLLALSGWGQEEDRRQAAEAGFDHHVTKPVTAAALCALLAATDSYHAGARPEA